MRQQKKQARSVMMFFVFMAAICLVVSFSGQTTLKTAMDPYQSRFMELWDELHDPANGYFSPEGVPIPSRP